MSQASFLSLQKNKKIYLLAFLLPVVIVSMILVINRVYPFGEECFLRTDMYHQYAPFMSEFRHKLQNGGSLLYSWDVGLGVNFVALYAYYLASPLNWFVVLVDEAFVIEFIMLMVVLKIGLCGLSMAFYLMRHGRGGYDLGVILFSVFYALSGYMCAYYWNIMWLDCIVLFPLVILGMERLVRGKAGGLYTLALGLSILSNYYISIMTCIFLCMYFAAYMVLEGSGSLKSFISTALRFIWYSLLSGGLAAVLLLPEIAAMSYTASADIRFPEVFSEYFSIMEMLVRHLPGIQTEQALDHWPNIYCGVGVLILFPLYLQNRRISLKEKTVYVLLLILMLMGFSINAFNFLWHGLHYPNSLPARQSYIYIFLLITLCYRLYQKKRFIRANELRNAFLFAMLFLLYCQHTIGSGDQDINFSVYYISMGLLTLYVFLIYTYLHRGLKRRTIGFLLFCLVALEAAGNTAATGITTTSRVSYVKGNDDIRALLDGLFPSTELFRLERVQQKTRNDGAWLNFPSASLFSSVASAGCSDFFSSLGCEGSTNAYGTNGSTPFTDMLFSVRYAIYDSAQAEGEGKKFIESMGESYLYENRYVLPVGFVISSEMYDGWMLELDDPVLVQNSFCDMLATSSVLKLNGEQGNTDGEEYAVTITQDGEYYALIKNPAIRDATVLWPEKRKTFNNVDRGYLLDLGDCARGETIRISSETKGQTMEVEVYRFDYEALSEAYEKLKKGAIELDTWDDTYLKGSIDISKDMLETGKDTARLFFSIPYDEGWQISIDGRPVLKEKAFGAFLSVAVPSGKHVIELSYMPEGLKEGAMISASSLLLFGLSTLIYRKRLRRSAKKQEEHEGI